MSRCRVVQPDSHRIMLVDTHQRFYDELVARVNPKATDTELQEARANIVSAQSAGDWVELKKELNSGELREVYDRQIKSWTAGEKSTIDARMVGITRILGYLIAWSFCGPNDKPVPYSLEMSEQERFNAINALDIDSYAELLMAVDYQAADAEAAREARKNVQAGASA